jgi:hypothetical protein
MLEKMEQIKWMIHENFLKLFFFVKSSWEQCNSFPDFLLIKIIAFFMMMMESLMISRSYWDLNFLVGFWPIHYDYRKITVLRRAAKSLQIPPILVFLPRSIIFPFGFFSNWITSIIIHTTENLFKTLDQMTPNDP